MTWTWCSWRHGTHIDIYIDIPSQCWQISLLYHHMLIQLSAHTVQYSVSYDDCSIGLATYIMHMYDRIGYDMVHSVEHVKWSLHMVWYGIVYMFVYGSVVNRCCFLLILISISLCLSLSMLWCDVMMWLLLIVPFVSAPTVVLFR